MQCSVFPQPSLVAASRITVAAMVATWKLRLLISAVLKPVQAWVAELKFRTLAMTPLLLKVMHRLRVTHRLKVTLPPRTLHRPTMPLRLKNPRKKLPSNSATQFDCELERSEATPRHQLSRRCFV